VYILKNMPPPPPHGGKGVLTDSIFGKIYKKKGDEKEGKM
jgi:hypothetical protein